jgi:hypothetical protein
MGQSELHKTIQLSSRSVIRDKNSLEDINKLFDEINQKIKTAIEGEANKNQFIYYNYSKPKFNIINQKELEINVELGTGNKPFTFNYNNGILRMLLFRPIKFSNQVDLNEKLEIVKLDNINRLRGLNELTIIQEVPPIFKLIDQDEKSVETFSTPQTESINLSDLFPYRSISNLEENTLIYNVGLLVLKPDLKNDQWKNVVDQYNRKNEVAANVNPSKKTLLKNEIILKKNVPFPFTYSCWNCFGQKIFLKNKTKYCSNCSYWTKDQKKYNYCSICRNERWIVLNQTKTQCKVCTGVGTLTSNVSNGFKELLKKIVYDDSKTNIFSSKNSYRLNEDVLLRKVATKDLILFTDYEKNVDIILHSSGNAVVSVESSISSYQKGKYSGTWGIVNGEFNLKADLAYKDGDKTVYEVISFK